MRRLLPSLVLVLVALAAPATAHGAASRAEYVVQAEPYCASANHDIAQLNQRFRRLHKAGRYDAAGQVLRKTGTRLSTSIEQVRRISPPPGDEQTISSWLDLVQQIADNNLRLGTAEARERFGVVARIEGQNGRIAKHAHQLIQNWGFYACAGN